MQSELFHQKFYLLPGRPIKWAFSVTNLVDFPRITKTSFCQKKKSISGLFCLMTKSNVTCFVPKNDNETKFDDIDDFLLIRCVTLWLWALTLNGGYTCIGLSQFMWLVRPSLWASTHKLFTDQSLPPHFMPKSMFHADLIRQNITAFKSLVAELVDIRLNCLCLWFSIRYLPVTWRY